MKFKLTIGAFIGFVALAVSIFFAAVVAVIDYRVTSKLDGVLWTVPAKIYSRPLELAEGFNFNSNNLMKELEMLSYKKVSNPQRPGQFSFSKNELKIFLRGYMDQKPGIFSLAYEDSQI